MDVSWLQNFLKRYYRFKLDINTNHIVFVWKANTIHWLCFAGNEFNLFASFHL